MRIAVPKTHHIGDIPACVSDANEIGIDRIMTSGKGDCLWWKWPIAANLLKNHGLADTISCVPGYEVFPEVGLALEVGASFASRGLTRMLEPLMAKCGRHEGRR